jgi:hypothetical protein
VLAGASGGGDVDSGEIDDVDLGELDGALDEAGVEADGSDNEGGEDDSGGEGEDDSVVEEKVKSKVKFTLKSNFNQIIMNEESYEGAIVLKPKTDIYTEDPIVVLDFSSLYPSEMITSDLSHDRICEDPYWLGDSGVRHLEQLGLSYLDRTYDNFEWIDPKKRSKGKRKCGESLKGSG